MNDITINNIIELLHSEDKYFSGIGFSELFSRLPDTIPVCIDLILDSNFSDEKSEIIIENLKRNFPFLRPYFGQKDTVNKQYKLFNDQNIIKNQFLTCLEAGTKRIDGNINSKIINRLFRLQGIESELDKLFKKSCNHKYSNYSPDDIHKENKHDEFRQLMIFPSMKCNLACPYCFSENSGLKDLTLSEVKKIIDWAVKNNVGIVTFCGGEPTLYKYFPEVLEYTRKSKLKTYFATNLLAPQKVIDAFNSDFVESLILHISEKESYSEYLYRLLNKNIESVLNKNIHINFRINVYKKNQNWDHLFELSRKFKIYGVQFALTFPSTKKGNKYVSADRFEEFIPEVLNLMKICDEKGIDFSFSKPLPVCKFPAEFQNRMLKDFKYSPICFVFSNNFTQNVCILPDMNLSPCLALTNKKFKFDTNLSWKEISGFCRSEILPLLNNPLYDECQDCFLYHDKICQGACLGFKRE